MGTFSINGQNLNAAFDIGPSVNAMANSAYAFLQQNNNQNQVFLGNSIMGTQDFLSHQLTPLSSAIALTQKQNAAMIPTAIQDFQSQTLAQTAAFTNAVNMGYSTIYQNTVNTNQASTQVANSGGGSFVCTAMYERDIITEHQYECLNKLRDFMLDGIHSRRKLLKYYREAPALVFCINKSAIAKTIYCQIRDEYLLNIITDIEHGCMEIAAIRYESMMHVIEAICKQITEPFKKAA